MHREKTIRNGKHKIHINRYTNIKSLLFLLLLGFHLACHDRKPAPRRKATTFAGSDQNCWTLYVLLLYEGFQVKAKYNNNNNNNNTQEVESGQHNNNPIKNKRASLLEALIIVMLIVG